MIPVPFNEDCRLAALEGLGVLDTPAEECIDRITRLAKRHFDVPIALVSLVDGTRQWFKSAAGLDAPGTAREISFCGHAIMHDDVLVVPDAANDPRFAENPLVRGEPHIRFYAGAPLLTPSGFRLGTLCIIDRRPRASLDEEQQATLRDLADMVTRELYLRGGTGDGSPAPALVSEAERDLAEDARFFFLASLTHELRTPMNAVMGFSEAIARELFGPIANRKYLDYARHINESGRHLLNLINTVLCFAKTRSGEMQLNEEWVDIAEAVRLCETMFEEQLRRSGISLACRLAADLPPLKADPQQVVQILVNLIGNSLKFTEAGGTVAVTASPLPDGGLTLSVVDSGIGIDRADIETVLAPFGQVDNPDNRVCCGTGLGLPLSQRLMALHGGALAIKSAPGVGTTVALRFPPYRVGSPPVVRQAVGFA